MKVHVRAGELVADLLYKQTGSDDDALEQEFYRINPHVRGDTFQNECVVTIPTHMTSTRKQKITRSWD